MIENKPDQGADVVRRSRARSGSRTTTIADAVQQARQVHGVLLLRVDVDAEQHEHAPQRLLPGLRARCRQMPFSSLDSQHPEDLWNWMDGQRKAGNELLAHLAQRQPLRRPHVPDRRRQQGPPDRRRLGRVARPQRAADRDQADQGHSRRRTRSSRPPTSSPTTRSVAFLLGDPARPHPDDPRQLSRARP